MNKTIGLLSKLQTILITIHTIFVRHHLGHGDTLHVTRNAGGIPHIKVKSISFKNTFFPYAVIEWNKLDPTIWKAESFSIFKSKKFFNCYNHKGLILD